ncbi:hypothetical protein M404DRAFT_533678 [Pisolithus tinctorius Marx 270]|uniref:Uncharacterized protein n=1 Tax=Pisolithus tinctorius Marx 270 TaxID=870435 RepID=A0A0C3PAZ5_PISTI|nr:hypothetical protein M404DRAFT_533678 [Pisolithus tinctorius Marx 270]
MGNPLYLILSRTHHDCPDCPRAARSVVLGDGDYCGCGCGGVPFLEKTITALQLVGLSRLMPFLFQRGVLNAVTPTSGPRAPKQYGWGNEVVEEQSTSDGNTRLRLQLKTYSVLAHGSKVARTGKINQIVIK